MVDNIPRLVFECSLFAILNPIVSACMFQRIPRARSDSGAGLNSKLFEFEALSSAGTDFTTISLLLTNLVKWKPPFSQTPMML